MYIRGNKIYPQALRGRVIARHWYTTTAIVRCEHWSGYAPGFDNSLRYGIGVRRVSVLSAELRGRRLSHA